MTNVTEEQFSNIMQLQLGDFWDRSLAIFRNCGQNLAFDVLSALRHAADRRKVPEVLEILEKHYREHLQFQDPEIRGMVRDNLLHVNPTEVVFLQICEITLGMKKMTA